MNTSRGGRGGNRGWGNYNRGNRIEDKCQGTRPDGRPAHLKGKEIGMYYRNLHLKKKIHLDASVSVPSDILQQVEQYLTKFNQSFDDEHVSHEFVAKFLRLLSVNYEDFLIESKLKQRKELDAISDAEINEKLKSKHKEKVQNDIYQKRYRQRQKLPAMKQSSHILQAIAHHQITLIVGSTGCGKTTQVPQMILDQCINTSTAAGFHIICTQPRRISAISVSERVAYERCEPLGDTVGYLIRLENCLPRNHCSILFCTTGVILQRMQTDPLLSDVKVLILDEIHERNVETDLLMGILKIVLPHRPDLKIILMSATVCEELFCEYFNNCYTIHIEGTLFPVEVLYLEDILQETGYTNFGISKQPRFKRKNRRQTDNQFSHRNSAQMTSKYDEHVLQSLDCEDAEGCENLQFIEFLIFYICENKPPGAILVFLPGYDTISKLHNQLQNPSLPRHRVLAEKLKLFPLHSSMPTAHQKSIFESPPANMRKVILSTILAETSVTIDDVVYVINSGRTKLSEYDVEANIQTLQEVWITKANSMQRKGRAGRVQPGICYNLFTRLREMNFLDAPVPEILRTKLEGIILNLKLLHIQDVSGFLNTLISIPNPRTVQNGIDILKRIEALDGRNIITPLGVHLARLPIDPQIGKMVLMAGIFRCLDPVSSAAAGISFKSPFYSPLGLEKSVDRTKLELADNCKSDHLLTHKVIEAFRLARQRNNERDYCYKNFVSIHTVKHLENMKQQFADLLKCYSFTESADCLARSSNVNSNNITLVRAIIAAGLYPNIACLRKLKQVRNRVHAIHKMSTPEEPRINFHPSSVNSGQACFDSKYFVYFQKQRSSGVYMLDSTMVFPMALLIFGDGVDIGRTPENQYYISVAEHYKFKCDLETSNVILKLREKLKLLLQKKALHPSPIEANSNDDNLVKAIQMLISLDDIDNYQDDDLTSDEEDD